MKKTIILLGIFLVAWQLAIGGEGAAMELKSPEFKNNGYIPKRFTRRGEDVNPAKAELIGLYKKQ